MSANKTQKHSKDSKSMLLLAFYIVYDVVAVFDMLSNYKMTKSFLCENRLFRCKTKRPVTRIYI